MSAKKKTKKIVKIIGYVVISSYPNRGIMRRTPRGASENPGGLWFHNGSEPATVFASREEAREAIDISLLYSKSKGYSWDLWLKDASIIPVAGPQ